MALGPMTRKWLVTIFIVLALVLAGVWLYTTWAADEVESDVADDPVSSLSAPPDVAGSGTGPVVAPAPRPVGSS